MRARIKLRIRLAVCGRVVLATGLALSCGLAGAQATPAPNQPTVDAATQGNEQKARAALEAMIKAMGGDAWLNLKNIYIEGRTTGFYQGNPTGAITNLVSYRGFPDKERVELGKKRDVLEFFNGNQAWEVTYRGKRALPKDVTEDYQRRRDHSIDTAVRVWLKDPKTVLIFNRQTMVERQLADEVTLISASNDRITIQMDAQSHLPLGRSWSWRDPLYKDINTDAEQYTDYHTVDGFPTAYTITRLHNGDMTNIRYLYKAAYNVPEPPGLYDVDDAASKIKKKK